MGSSSGQQEQDRTVTSETKIPEWLEGPMQRGVEGAGALYGQGEPGFFPGQTYADFSPQTEQSLGMTEQMAGQPDPYGALSNYQGLMGGDYLHGGSGFNAALDAAQRQIAPRVASSFGLAGRNRSGLADEAMAGAIADRFAGMYGQERSNQMQGLGMAGQMEGLRGLPAARLAQVGGMREGQAQRGIDEDRARYDAQAYAPQVGLDRYLSRVTGVAPFGGQSSSQTSPMYRNQMAGMAGGAMSGLGMAGQLFPAAGPWGMAAGGLLGALGGMG